MYFTYEKLEVYALAVGVARAALGVRVNASLRDQLVRAAQSVVLNIAEGSGLSGDARKRHYRIALGSAAEVGAAFDLAGVGGELANNNRRVAAMLGALTR